MCTLTGARSFPPTTGKKEPAAASLFVRWLLGSAGSPRIFPCPAIFSQVLIFSLCQSGSRQPPHHFQSCGLHANCPSIAWLPPTYIMHLVSSARPGRRRRRRHPSSLTFRRDESCRSSTSGCNQADLKNGIKSHFLGIYKPVFWELMQRCVRLIHELMTNVTLLLQNRVKAS